MNDKLTIGQCAARAGMPKRTVLYAAQTGRLPAERVGDQGIFLVTENDLRVWLAGREDEGSPDSASDNEGEVAP